MKLKYLLKILSGVVIGGIIGLCLTTAIFPGKEPRQVICVSGDDGLVVYVDNETGEDWGLTPEKPFKSVNHAAKFLKPGAVVWNRRNNNQEEK